MHVKGGGRETKIGQNGKPLSGSPALSKEQQKVIEENIKQIRKAAKQMMKWFRFNEK